MKTFVDLRSRGLIGDIGGQNFLGKLYLLEALCELQDLKACFDESLPEVDPVLVTCNLEKPSEKLHTSHVLYIKSYQHFH